MSKRMKEKERKEKKGLKVFGIIVLILIILLVTLIGGIFLFINNKLNKMQLIDIDKGELGISEKADEGLAEYRNIAIFAVDSRDNNLERGNRSDGIIIASINNTTKDVNLISVYRDSYVEIEGYGLDKINHAYSYGSAPLAIKTLNNNLDLNIKEFVTVNFDAVAEAVNELGGVEINIERDELNYINDYISGTSNNTGITSNRITNTGIQTLDGVQAVAYARIRYTEGGDLERAERMRDVIEAMVNKLKTKSIGEINRFVDKILPKVYTNIRASEIFSLMPNMMSYNISNSIGWPYDTRGITLDRWYGVPVTLESNVTRLHKEVFGNEEYVISDEIKLISDKIVSRTGYSK